MKYGYESVVLLVRPLRNSMGQLLRSLKWEGVFPRLSIILKDYWGKNMDIKIQKKPAFTVACPIGGVIDNSQCPSAWDLYNTNVENLESLGSTTFRVCSGSKKAK